VELHLFPSYILSWNRQGFGLVKIFEKPLSYFYVFWVQVRGIRFLKRLVSHTYQTTRRYSAEDLNLQIISTLLFRELLLLDYYHIFSSAGICEVKNLLICHYGRRAEISLCKCKVAPSLTLTVPLKADVPYWLCDIQRARRDQDRCRYSHRGCLLESGLITNTIKRHDC
jgi:hypothetical protein